jgi:hypothetical protein
MKFMMGLLLLSFIWLHDTTVMRETHPPSVSQVSQVIWRYLSTHHYAYVRRTIVQLEVDI